MAEIQNWDKVLTREGYERLKKELDYLIRVKRPEIAEKIRRAREYGDLSENAEYHAARRSRPWWRAALPSLSASCAAPASSTPNLVGLTKGLRNFTSARSRLRHQRLRFWHSHNCIYSLVG
jgi:hypothetical protein